MLTDSATSVHPLGCDCHCDCDSRWYSVQVRRERAGQSCGCAATGMTVFSLRAGAGLGFGYLTYKRPKLAAGAAGLVAFTTLPYVSVPQDTPP